MSFGVRRPVVGMVLHPGVDLMARMVQAVANHELCVVFAHRVMVTQGGETAVLHFLIRRLILG